MRARTLLAVVLLLAAVTPAIAADGIDQIDILTQAEFRDLSGDLGAATAHNAVVPTEGRGIAGFDIGFEVTATRLVYSNTWDRASSGGAPAFTP